jgi:hypothetical protein
MERSSYPSFKNQDKFMLSQSIKSFLLALFVSSIQLVTLNDSSAAPTQRGFQIPLESITESTLDDLRNNWNANILRVQIGNNVEMDGKTGAAYDSMMEERFSLLDQKLPLIAAKNLKIIFCLYSPPGGFLTRESPSHHRMYAEPSLQDDYIAKWRQIITRYGTNSTIAAFDIDNEPAMRKELLASGARTWNTLVLDVIKAIREINPSVQLIVKSLYGDPSKLTSLPAINDANLTYAYNAYFYNSYQHTGITSVPFSIARPSDAAILQNVQKRVGNFYYKIYTRVEKKELPASAFPPKLTVGEATTSSCALESGEFLNGLLTALESDVSVLSRRARDRALSKWRASRRKNRRAKKPVFKAPDFYRDVAHNSYTIHAYGESPFWDPRYNCDSSGNLTLASSDTDRAIVIKGMMSKNSF